MFHVETPLLFAQATGRIPRCSIVVISTCRQLHRVLAHTFIITHPVNAVKTVGHYPPSPFPARGRTRLPSSALSELAHQSDYIRLNLVRALLISFPVSTERIDYIGIGHPEPELLGPTKLVLGNRLSESLLDL